MALSNKRQIIAMRARSSLW